MTCFREETFTCTKYYIRYKRNVNSAFEQCSIKQNEYLYIIITIIKSYICILSAPLKYVFRLRGYCLD